MAGSGFTFHHRPRRGNGHGGDGHADGRRDGHGDGRRDGRGDGFNNGGYGGYPVVSTPYYYGAGDIVDPVDDSMEQSYAPGPTVFDRRSPDSATVAYTQQLDQRLDRLEQQLDEVEQAKPSTASVRPEPPMPAHDQPETILVFRDGHTVTVKNYVIVGNTMYDYSGDARRKIDLGELDVTATQKQNEDRGIDFRLPAHTAGT